MRHRHQPNDTLTVTISDPNQSVTLLGDPGLPTGGWGGNDSLSATITNFGSVANLVGEDETMHRNSRGGDDTLAVTIAAPTSVAFVWGDASVAMYDCSRGGNDTITLNDGGGYASSVLVGDAEAMFDHAHGGNDTIKVTATLVSASFAVANPVLDGDASSSMSGHTKGGDDTLIAVTHTVGRNGGGVTLNGDAGGDMTDMAHGGNDALTATMDGGQTSALLRGDAGGDMTDSVHGGNDTLAVTILSGQFNAGYLSGDAGGSMTGTAHGGNDTLTATVNGQELIGSLTFLSLSGDAGLSIDDKAYGGDDILTVEASYSEQLFYPDQVFLFGDAPNMSGRAHGGNDVLNGGGYADFLYGDAQNYAPSAPGSITGGKDTLNGGEGDDQLWGGPNNDKFVFKAGSGNDTIWDFDTGNLAVGSTAAEHDVIDVHGYGFKNWNALRAVIQDDGSGNAVVHLSANDTITIVGVATAHLHASDFVV